MFESYYGLIELVFVIIAFGGFIIWQMRVTNRDIKAREARERAAAENQKKAQ
ncbi:MAG: hypothetical protein AAGG69_02415 [Pseudomonadota bacterium]